MSDKIGGLPDFNLSRLTALDNQAKKLSQEVKPAFEDEQAKKAAKDFESLLLKQMFDSMWSTVPKDSILNGKDQEFFRDMYNQSLAENMAENQELGIAKSIYSDMKKRK